MVYITSDEGIEYTYEQQEEEGGIRHILRYYGKSWRDSIRGEVCQNLFEPNQGDGVVLPKLGGLMDWGTTHELCLMLAIIGGYKIEGYKYLTEK